MLTQTTERVDGGWKSYDRVFVPGNIKAIMVILLIASIFLSNYFQKKHNDANKKSSTIALLNIMNVVIGFLIIIVEG